MDPLIGQTILGRYLVMERLGQGRMGPVYRVEQVSMKRAVALRMLKEELASDDRVVAAFQAAARGMARLNSRHIMRIYDFDQTETGRVFISMEYVAGESLGARLNRVAALSVRHAVKLAVQIGQGLHEAHRIGVLHRDLKPQNIMVQPDDSIKIMDFGLPGPETVRSDDVGSVQVVNGTLRYMAPERIRAGEASERTDIYAFGITLYEMLTGVVPFDGPASPDVIAKVMDVSCAPPRLTILAPDAPRALEALVMQMIERDPERRPPDCDAVVRRLAAIGDQVSGDATNGTVIMPAALPTTPKASDGHGSHTDAAAEVRAPDAVRRPGASRPRRALLFVGAPAVAIALLGGGLYAAFRQPSKGSSIVGTTTTPGTAAGPIPRSVRPAQDSGAVPTPPASGPSVAAGDRPPTEIPPAPGGTTPAPSGTTSAPADSRQTPPVAEQPAQTTTPAPVKPTTKARPPAKADDSGPTRRPETARTSRPSTSPSQASQPPEPLAASTNAPAPRAATDAQVRDRLKSQGLSAITVEVSESGVATLSGVLNTREERQRAVDVVRATPGITDVRSRINVRESWQTPSSSSEPSR